MKKIAFFGLGNMGLPMASNLAAKHSGVLCCDISSTCRQTAAEAGLKVTDDAVAAVQGADAVLTMLPAGKHVEALLIGDTPEAGLLARAARGTLFVDCSTTAPPPAQRVAAAAASAGQMFVDAPVSGGIGAARAGTLSFLCGGAAEQVACAKPLLAAMGANIFHAGDTGAGQAAKLCNNMMLSVQMIGACEALALGKKMGLDSKTLSEIMAKSSGGNWVVEKYNPVPGVMENMPASNNYQGGFMVDLMVKDSDLAMQAAQEVAAAVPLSAAANALFREHQQEGSGNLDFGSILRLIEKRRPAP